MSFIADLHIHSHFSLATSKELTPEHLHLWAMRKGVDVIGTGDCIHPGWLSELQEKLEPTQTGLYRLKTTYHLAEENIPEAQEPLFILSTEISNIYKKKGRVRKVHNILIIPDFRTASLIQQKLKLLGFNITSDGRPILGMDSYDLLRLVLDINPRCVLVPAHIWTPWFSVLGASSGFDSIEECFEDLTPYIHTLETGLSSDVPMNRVIGKLDRFHLISNSDAHSPDRLGRNANIFFCDKSLDAISEAMARHQSETIDLFPQEGKYHFAGHRKCKVSLPPDEAAYHQGICPVCHKKLTSGVLDRVFQLASKTLPDEESISPRFHYIIPLPEIIAEIINTKSSSKKVMEKYFQTLKILGPELKILLQIPCSRIAEHAGGELAEAIERLRQRRVMITPGYDGEYGVIKVFRPGEAQNYAQKSSLFHDESPLTRPTTYPLLSFNIHQVLEQKVLYSAIPDSSTEQKAAYPITDELQKAAIAHDQGPAVVIAGPGSGKTYVLTERIARLISQNIAPSEKILAITFTTRAAQEMRQRLMSHPSLHQQASSIPISTIHALGLQILREIPPYSSFRLISEAEKIKIIQSFPQAQNQSSAKIANYISLLKNHALNFRFNEVFQEIANEYEFYLHNNQLMDYEDLILLPLNLMRENDQIYSQIQNRYRFILVDEFQDVNPAQYDFLKIITHPQDNNLFVIGDPLQSIYGFRGAYPSIFETFLQDFPQSTTYRLGKSYRCGDKILKAAYELIGSGNGLEGVPEKGKVNIVQHATDRSEAEFIARSIDATTGGTRFFAYDSGVAQAQSETPLSEFAILCRTTRQFPAIITALNNHGLPYQTAQAGNLIDSELLAEIILYLRKILETNKENNGPVENLLKNYFVQNLPEKNVAKDDQKIFMEIARDFGNDVKGFIDFIDLNAPIGLYANKENAVQLLTLHAAKGLEFEHVFISGCEEGIIPYSLFENQEADTEEEKRLLFVGMTRAKKTLSLNYADSRKIFHQNMNLPPSHFLSAISPTNAIRTKSNLPEKREGQQLSFF